MFTTPLSRTGKSIFLRCMLFLLLGVMLSYTTMTALAADVTGSTYTFMVGPNEYSNYARLQTNARDAYSEAGIKSITVLAPAGYLGLQPMLYKQVSGGYSLVHAGAWWYSSSVERMISYIIADYGLANGYYMAQGNTAVYYSGGYVTTYTYGTPLVQVP